MAHCTLLCIFAAIASPLCGQSIQEISSSRVVQLTPSLRDGHQPPVITGVAVQRHGRLMATVGDDHVVRIWDLIDGRLLRSLESHVDWVRAVTFSPDGSALATAGNDRLVVFWDPETGRRESSLEVPEAVSTLVYSPDGKLLATAGFGSTLRLHDTVTGRTRRELDCACRDMRCAAFSPDGRHLAAAGRDGCVHVWETAGGTEVHDVQVSNRRLRGIAFSHDGRQIITAGEDRKIHVLDAGDGRELFQLPVAAAKVIALVVYAPDGLATAGSDNEIRLWDLAARRQTARLSGHTGSVAALDYQDELLVSGSFDTTVRIWPIGRSGSWDNRAERIDSPRIR